MTVRDEIVWRSGLIYFTLVIVALAMLFRIIVLQYFQRGKWAEMGERYVFKTAEMPANRGDILSYDGRLLASSVPYYSIYMDTRSTGMLVETWLSGINGLSEGLARLLGERSAQEWKNLITNARRRGERFFLIKRRVNYATLKKLKELPIFREGQFKGGLVAQPENRRILPHSELAARTIGYLSLDTEGTRVGLEGSYNRELSGKNGLIVKQRLTGGDWIPLNNAGSVEPKDGNDIVTTIDIDLQDVASSALEYQLRKHNAHHGCAVVMEVATGDIRAIANLEQAGDNTYHETYNYAVGESTEPGSTFKLPVLMAAIEDGVIDTGDIVDTGNGSIKFYSKIIRDTKEGGYGKLTVKEVFEKSSNVGTSKIITDNYNDNPKAFINRLYAMKLHQKLDLQIRGEGSPLIRYPGDKLWSGLSLPMMSYGYEVQMTPLQILTFYNAVANDGKMMRPRFVTAIIHKGKVVKSFGPKVIVNSIASRSTIKKAKKMMEGVVENGTAINLKSADYKIAGKTGTAQIANKVSGYSDKSKISYQASFVGYFPADNPKYSCIVVVNSPSREVYYGNLVAGPVFKEIADKVIANEISIQLEKKDELPDELPQLPFTKNSYKKDLQTVLDELNMPYNVEGINSDWVLTSAKESFIELQNRFVLNNIVPNIKGMGAKDAIYILENIGLKVEIVGRGMVKKQSVKPGAIVRKGQTIRIELG